MATYSRSQSTSTQTTQSSAIPSMDISSLLVKTMENVMNDNQEDDKGFEESITNGINNSDLLKDKTKSDNDKELNDLLKDKKNTDKELSNLLKDTNKNTKEEQKKKGNVKSDSDKIADGFGKIVKGGALAGVIGGIMGGKGVGGAIKGATSGAITGAGRTAGGLVSGVGNIGGSLIAGVGKLFGPVGAMIGKFVGTAVAAPFKILGGTITTVVGGLGKLMSMPLKELVTKGTLIVGVLSQLFVFLEGLVAKFIAQKDVKWIDFMSKLKSNIAVIPDKLMLSLEKLLSKVKIMGHPILGGGLTKDEKKELKALEKKDTKLTSAQDKLMGSAETWLGKEEASQYNIADPEQREALKQAMLAKTKGQVEQGIMPAVSEDDINKYFSNYEKAAAKSKMSPEDQERLAELRALKSGGGIDFEKKEREIAEKQQGLQEKYFTEGLYDLSKKQVKDKNGNIVTRGLTQYEQDYADSLHAGSTAAVKGMHAEAGTDLVTKDATGAERFLANQYKQWTDSWSKMFKDLKQDIGINITQKQEIPNPTFNQR